MSNMARRMARRTARETGVKVEKADEKKLKRAEAAMNRDLRRADARTADLTRLNFDRKLPLMGFDWKQRYSAVYLGAYARRKGWQLSRLTRAVETLDLRFRIVTNFILAKKRAKERGF